MILFSAMLLLVAAECAGHTYLFTRSSSLSLFIVLLLHCPSSSLSFFSSKCSLSSSLSFFSSSSSAFFTNSKHWQLQFFSCWPRIIVCFSTGECFTGLRTSTAVWRPSLLSCLYSPPSSFFPSSGQGAHHHKGLDMVEHPAEYTSVRNVFALPKSTEFYPPS